MTVLPHQPEYRKSGRTGELWSGIEISAAPERVWEILTAFAAYPDWNPFIRKIRGDLIEGWRITARPPPVRIGCDDDAPGSFDREPAPGTPVEGSSPRAGIV